MLYRSIFGFLTFEAWFVQWADKVAYKDTLTKLAGLFTSNFKKFTNYSVGSLTESILAAGPQI